MEEIPKQKYLRYKSAEHLPKLEAMLEEIGIIKAEKGNGDLMREMTDNKVPYYEIIERINTIIVKQLEDGSRLEHRIKQYNSGLAEAQKIVVEAVGRVYKHKEET